MTAVAVRRKLGPSTVNEGRTPEGKGPRLAGYVRLRRFKHTQRREARRAAATFADIRRSVAERGKK